MTSMYCTLYDARQQLSVLPATDKADDDAILKQSIIQASRRVDQMLTFGFEPVIKTTWNPIDGNMIDSVLRLLRLAEPMLAITGVTVYATDLTVGTDVQEFPPDSIAPYWDLQLVSLSGSWYSTYYSSSAAPAIKLTGTFGYHPDYGNAWQAEDALAAGVNDSVTSLTVADADGSDWRGLTPRFSPGALLKVDSEFMRVTAVDTDTNVLTVIRGENGSTAAAHLASAVVYCWAWPEDIRQAVARQAALNYKRRGSFEATSMLGVGSGYPVDLTPDLHAVIGGYLNYG